MSETTVRDVSTPADREPVTYSPYTAIAAEGARIAVVTCQRCGAMVMIDPHVPRELTGPVLHDAWHEEADRGH